MDLRTLRTATTEVKSWDPRRSTSSAFVYVDLSSIDQERKIISGGRLVDTAEAPSRARQVVQTGDVLVSTVRPNLNGVARVTQDFDGATASTGFTVLRPGRDLDGSYLFQWVRSPMFISDMVGRATGASYPAISDRIVYESRIPLPPLEEQRRIAAILDHADALRAKRREALTHLEALAQSIFFDMFGEPVLNKRAWPRYALGDLLATIDSGTSPVCLARPALDGEWGVLKLGAVTRCRYRASENKALPDSVAPRQIHEVRRGDILFSRKNTRELVAACVFVTETPARLLLPDLIFRLNPLPHAGVHPIYLQQLLIFPTKRSMVQGLAGGSAGSMPNISKEKLRTLLVELPPLPLQELFADKVAGIEKLRSEQLRQSTDLDILFASLQQRAFSGQL